MSSSDATTMAVDRNQIKIQLRNLREWRHEYHNGTPLVSDAVFDDVEDQVRSAVSELPDGDALRAEIVAFLAEVGAPVPGEEEGIEVGDFLMQAPVTPAAPAAAASSGAAGAHWVKVKHRAPAGSLNKAQSPNELLDWHAGCLRLIGLGNNPFVLGTQVRTVQIDNPSTDWSADQATLRRFGVIGTLRATSNSHGTCFEVEHDDDSTTAWYEPRELDGPQVVRGTWSEKLDGISILMYYVGGYLRLAVTRGDGDVGEDITRNVLRMKGVVSHIPGLDGDVRGEIILTKSDHQAHFPTYANPRNAASGIAKRIDGAGCEHLTVVVYRLRKTSGTRSLTSKATELRVLSRLGARVPNWGVFVTLTEANQVYNNYVSHKRASLDYEIDGLVYEVDSQTHMDTLGDLNNRPRGAVAFKFPHDQKPTVIRDITWQVGNTGRITPVAIFDVVSLAGANVTNASLHNLSNIAKILAPAKRDNFIVGDMILVSRRNDVIPFVESLVTACVDPTARPLAKPEVCPSCGTEVKRDGEYLVCPNTEMCTAQISGAVKRWVAGLGLKGWGDAIIDALCDQGYVSDPADLYTLDAGELAEIQMGGRRLGSTADTILAELNAKGRDLPIHVFIGSLNIPLCSRSTCLTIADAGFDSLAKMRAASATAIAAIPGMGTGRGDAFADGMVDKATLIDKLIANGVNIRAKAIGSLTGKSFCFTGFRDSDLQEKIEGLGGTMKSSAVKGLTYLVAQDPTSNSGKSQKARSQGTDIIGIEDAWTLAGGRP